MLTILVPPAFSSEDVESPGSMASDLTLLEKEYGIEKEEDKSVFGRLQILEIEVFGSTKVGSLMDRIQAIKNASIERKATEDTSRKDTSDLERKDDENLNQYIKRLNKSLPYTNTSPARFYRITPVTRDSLNSKNSQNRSD